MTNIHCLEYDNSSVGEEELFKLRHLKEALLDWQVWLLSLINMTVTTAGKNFRLYLYYACSQPLFFIVYGIALFLPFVL